MPTTSIMKDWKLQEESPGWREALREEFYKPYFQQLVKFLNEERSKHEIYPPPAQIFNAFGFTDLPEIKVVILGQDPYHGRGQAEGLCFSVQDRVRIPPSLENIFKEIETDLGKPRPETGSLVRWAKQGVFLLNTVLTVRHRKPNSHRGKGWEKFTSRAVEIVSARQTPVVFLLWGRSAQAHKSQIDSSRHLVLEAPHPSPYSAHSGFFGCRHFSKTNEFLEKNGRSPVNW